jgi:predicted ester cyclase
MDVEGVLAEDDAVVVRARMRGTHSGEFLGVPATGRQIDVEAIDWVVVRDGKAVEHWGVTDVGALMMQIGAMEGAPAA